MSMLGILRVLEAIPITLLGAFPVGFILYFCYKSFIDPPKRSQRLQKAQRVIAQLDHTRIYGTPNPKEMLRSMYVYQVDGQVYNYTHSCYRHDLTETLTLYYMPGDAAHAKTEQLFTGTRNVYWKCYLLALPITLVLYLLYLLKSV